MTESFEEMKARYLKQMEEMREKVDRPSSTVAEPVQNVAVASPVVRQEEPPSNPSSPFPTDGQQQMADTPMQEMPVQPQTDSETAPAMGEEPMSEQPSTEQPQPSGQRSDREPGDTGEGYMTVWVVTADEALPVAGAEVVISRMIDGDQMLQGIGTTDISGRTRTFALPTPTAAMSQSPDNPTPFARYDVSVHADGFAHAQYTNIPVFDGIQSVQRVDLVPFTSDRQDVVVDEQSNTLSELSPEDATVEEGDVG